MSKSILVLAATLLLCMVLMFRWQLVIGAHTAGYARAYALDRWTGTIYLIEDDTKAEVKLTK
jgi:hypothetical protein